MKETLEIIIKNLVEFPDEVSVKEVAGEKSVVYEVKVAETDMGKVIGREGKIAGAIRTVMKALAAKEQKRVSVEFIG
jgi:predicted RNA-binding protein YlqC (UPF0109 family)